MFFTKRCYQIMGKVNCGDGGDGSDASNYGGGSGRDLGSNYAINPALSPRGMDFGPARAGFSLGSAVGGAPGAVLGGLSGLGYGISQMVSPEEAMGIGRGVFEGNRGVSAPTGGYDPLATDPNKPGGNYDVGNQILSVSPNSVVGGFLAPGTDGAITKTGVNGGAGGTGEWTQDPNKSYQENALDYQIYRDRLRSQFGDEGLRGLAGLYDMEGGTGSQQDLIDRAIQSPLYQSLMGGREAGEEAILRSASVTGGLRSGDVQSNMYDYNTQLKNQSLLAAYNQQLQGLQGLAGLPSGATEIARTMTGIGEDIDLRSTADRQYQADKEQRDIDKWMGIGKLGFEIADSGIFSDRRLKKNIKKVGERGGHNWYTWDWNIVANKMGLAGSSQGVIADEILKTDPDCVGFMDGFITVKYKKLGCFNQEVLHAS